MILFITGGCKNGKTSIAEKIVYGLSDKKNIFYIATMIPSDEEDIIRIKRHIDERKNYNFKTIEIKKDTSELKTIEGFALFDSLTAFLMNYMFFDTKNENTQNDLFEDIKPMLDNIIENKNLNVLFISDYIYNNANEINGYTEQYMTNLAKMDKYVASKADVVMEVVYGNIKYYKGKEYAKKINNCI